MGHVDVIRLGIVGAVLMAGWHGLWALVMATGWGPQVADFVMRMHGLQSEVGIAAFDPLMAAASLLASAVVGYAGGALAGAIWNCLDAVCVRGKAGAAARV